MYIQERNQQEFDKKEEIEYNYKEALEETEKLYKNRIEEIIMKNYQLLAQKDQEIAELEGVVRELETEIGRVNDEINKIQYTQDYSKNNTTKESKVIQENKKLHSIVDVMNQEINELNKKVASYEQ